MISFKGFADAIYNLYSCNVYLFEPVKSFYDLCEKRFANNPKIKCFSFGLLDSDGEFFISNEDNGASIVKNNTDENSENVQVRQFVATTESLVINHIDLLKINIEGGEFFVLPHIISQKFIQNIRYLQIQFHDFIPNAIEMRDQIRKDLLSTHKENWNYTFVWESWERKY